MNKLYSVMMIIIGIDIMIKPRFSFRGTIIDLSPAYIYIPVVSFFILIGIKIMYYELNKNKRGK